MSRKGKRAKSRKQDNHGDICVEVFHDELDKIMDVKIRRFVIDVFELLCPDYFWTCPASTTGKYHPLISLGEGGLIRHVKLAVWWGELFSLASHVTEKMCCKIIAALLLHDILKNGQELTRSGFPKDRNVVRTHGVDLAKAMIKNRKRLMRGGIDAESFEQIVAAVGAHMGIWTADKYELYRSEYMEDRTTKAIASIVSMSDFASAQKVDAYMETLMDHV